MHISNLNLLTKAVAMAYGTRLLNPKSSEKARSLLVHLGTAAGFSIGEIADALGCQLATVMKASWIFKLEQAQDPNEAEVMVMRVEAIVELLLNGDNQSADPYDGAICPQKISAEDWTDICAALGRSLRQTDDGLLECDAIIEAYQSVAGQLIPSGIARTILVPSIRSDDDNRCLELCFRSLALDHYAGADTPSWTVVLEPSLVEYDETEAA